MDQIPPLNALKTFEAAARNKGFARAAEELCVTQPAVSHQIRQLEEWFGIPLFERTGGRARLTPAGEGLASSLGEAFKDIRSACIRVRNQATRETLHVAVIPSVATCWLIPRLPEFNIRHPDIAIRLMYALYGQSIDFRQTDVAIVYTNGEPDVPGTRATQIFDGTAVPVCSRYFHETHGPLDTPGDIVRAPLLHDTDQQGWREWFVKATGTDRPFSEGPVFEDFNLMRSAALSGQGVALCPLSIIRDDLDTGRLVTLSDIAIHDEFTYYVLEPTTSRLETTREIAAFKNWVLETAGVRETEPA